MRLVTNASPLIFLAKVELLPMLRSCFLQVLAPPAVVAETRLDLPDFIECRELSEIGYAFVRGAIGTLDRGAHRYRTRSGVERDDQQRTPS